MILQHTSNNNDIYMTYNENNKNDMLVIEVFINFKYNFFIINPLHGIGAKHNIYLICSKQFGEANRLYTHCFELPLQVLPYQIKYYTSNSCCCLCRWLNKWNKHQSLPHNAWARFLFSAYSYTKIRWSPLRQQPFNLIKLRCLMPEMTTTSFKKSKSTNFDLINFFTATCVLSDNVPYKSNAISVNQYNNHLYKCYTIPIKFQD